VCADALVGASLGISISFFSGSAALELSVATLRIPGVLAKRYRWLRRCSAVRDVVCRNEIRLFAALGAQCVSMKRLMHTRTTHMQDGTANFFAFCEMASLHNLLWDDANIITLGGEERRAAFTRT
jgi:hypothetical protein